MSRVATGWDLFFQIRPRNLKFSGDMYFFDEISENDVRFPVKTGSCPTAMVDTSFDAQYPSYPSLVKVSDHIRNHTVPTSISGFIGKMVKTGNCRKRPKVCPKETQ